MKYRQLCELLEAPGVITLPGVYDGVSARIAESCGFPAVYMTGFGVVASAYGMPDLGTATYTEMVERVSYIASAINIPLLCDGDTGYGGLLNVDRTVRGYIQAGAGGIQLEDQEFPKRCGHTPGRRVIAIEDAARKIEIAAAARDSREFVIVARTDARTSLGIDEALRRADRFLSAGADVLFIESPESIDEMKRIGEAFKGVPLLANMVEGGRTPCLSADQLAELGYKIALYPITGLLAAAATLRQTYAQLLRTGSSSGLAALLPFTEMTELMGFPKALELEKRWS
jgi:2,3-dimethylmalate lyase